jgi:hypothetical protein
MECWDIMVADCHPRTVPQCVGDRAHWSLADFANTTFPLARPAVPNFTALLTLSLEIVIRSAAGVFDYSWQKSWNSSNGCIVMMTDQPACMSRRCVTKHVVQFNVIYHCTLVVKNRSRYLQDRYAWTIKALASHTGRCFVAAITAKHAWTHCRR